MTIRLGMLVSTIFVIPSIVSCTRPDSQNSGAAVTDPGDILYDWIAEGSGVWRLTTDSLILATAGIPGGPITKPSALILDQTSNRSNFVLEAEIRSTAAPDIIRADVLLVFGYRSASEFYYVHLSGVTDDVHNGIFLVNNADRVRIDDGTAAPLLPDREWHTVRLERDATSGSIRVFVDYSDEPGLIANDTTFSDGLVGFGSFDDTGIIRTVRISAM